MLFALVIGGGLPLASLATAMRTFSQRSPSSRSLPPRPSRMSLPPPPRMMLPPSNSLTLPPSIWFSSVCRPLISAMPSASSTLPLALSLRMLSAVALSPRRMSLCAEPDSPSTSAKRSRIPALEAGTGGSNWSLTIRSTDTPRVSFL
ncbi:hypothetical protein D9M70_329400 [compost metagenome]